MRARKICHQSIINLKPKKKLRAFILFNRINQLQLSNWASTSSWRRTKENVPQQLIHWEKLCVDDQELQYCKSIIIKLAS